MIIIIMQNIKASQHILERLFESPVKIKLLKLFLRNINDAFSFSEIRELILVDTPVLKRELQKLCEIGLIKKQTIKQDRQKSKSKAQRYTYSADPEFVFFKEVQSLVLKSSPADEDKLAKEIQGLGNIRLIILSGIFLKPTRGISRTDLLIVSDFLSITKFNNFIKSLGAEIGSEVNYTLFTTKEYEYRKQMFDRFLSDILEKPHKVLFENMP